MSFTRPNPIAPSHVSASQHCRVDLPEACTSRHTNSRVRKTSAKNKLSLAKFSQTDKTSQWRSNYKPRMWVRPSRGRFASVAAATCPILPLVIVTAVKGAPDAADAADRQCVSSPPPPLVFRGRILLLINGASGTQKDYRRYCVTPATLQGPKLLPPSLHKHLQTHTNLQRASH